MNTNEIIKRLRESRGLTQQQLAELIGAKTYTTITKWESGDNFPKGKDIRKLSEIFNVTADYILGMDERPPNLTPVSPQTVAIPILGQIACGDPINAEENFKGFRYKSPEGLPSGNLYILEAVGDSMLPTIPNGAEVLIREQPEVESSEIAAVLVNGDSEATLKRIRWQGGTLMLMPDNKDYEPIIASEDYPVKIIGKAVQITMKL